MTVPRNVLLIEELENAMKGKYNSVSFGIVNEDIDLKNWQGSIISSKGDIYEFEFVCDEQFPLLAPVLYFNKNTLPKICNNDGKIKDVILQKIYWNSNSSLGEYLMTIKKFIDNI